MNTLLIILLTLITMFLTCIAFFLINVETRTRKLRNNPKVGDNIRYYIGEDKQRGTIYKVFKTHVRVRDVFGEWVNVSFENIYATIL